MRFVNYSIGVICRLQGNPIPMPGKNPALVLDLKV